MLDCRVWTLCRWGFHMKRGFQFWYIFINLQVLPVQMEGAIQPWESSDLNLHFSSYSSLICLPEQPGQADGRVGGWQSQSGERWWQKHWICLSEVGWSDKSSEALKHRKEYLSLILNTRPAKNSLCIWAVIHQYL